MVTMAGSKCGKLAQHAHSHGLHAHTDINTLYEVPAQLLQNLESIFFPEGTWGRGSKPEYPEKNPDSLPANWYHILQNKIQRPGWDSNPHPPEHALCLTHWVTDWATDRH